MRKLIAFVAALIVLSSTASAAADPVVFAPGEPLNVRIATPSHLESDGGADVQLPPGVHVLGETEWTALDGELARLQESETRLTAERDSYKEAAKLPSWNAPVLVGIVIGAVVGMIVGARAF